MRAGSGNRVNNKPFAERGWGECSGDRDGNSPPCRDPRILQSCRSGGEREHARVVLRRPPLTPRRPAEGSADLGSEDNVCATGSDLGAQSRMRLVGYTLEGAL
jgi:hypothetical protein